MAIGIAGDGDTGINSMMRPRYHVHRFLQTMPRQPVFDRPARAQFAGLKVDLNLARLRFCRRASTFAVASSPASAHAPRRRGLRLGFIYLIIGFN